MVRTPSRLTSPTESTQQAASDAIAVLGDTPEKAIARIASHRLKNFFIGLPPVQDKNQQIMRDSLVPV
jgi:hypothetical protein